MTIKRCFFKMLVNEICFVEYIAAILIRQWIMNAALQNACLVKVAEVAKGRLELTLLGRNLEIESASQHVRMKHEKLVSVHAS